MWMFKVCVMICIIGAVLAVILEIKQYRDDARDKKLLGRTKKGANNG